MSTSISIDASLITDILIFIYQVMFLSTAELGKVQYKDLQLDGM